jgi:hypothetical protein
MASSRRLLTFDLDGVLCRPPFGINPGRNVNKARRTQGHATLLSPTERFRYYLRRPMAGAREGFASLAADYECHVLTARTERTRSVTEGWFRRWFGVVPPLHLRAGYDETPAAFKVRRVQELGAFAHFEDDPHTALWVADVLPLVFLVDWRRNRWVNDGRLHRIRRLAEARDVLAALPASLEEAAAPPAER